MLHNLAAPDAFADVVKVVNQNELWKAKFTWYSSSATLWSCFYGLEHGLRIYSFRPIWTCLIIEVLATWVKFLEPSGYCTVTNCAFTFPATNVFVCFCSVMHYEFELDHKFPNLTTLYMALKLYMNWSNACVSIPITMILPTTARTYHNLNCFGHMIFMLQTSMYQNIANLLTLSDIINSGIFSINKGLHQSIYYRSLEYTDCIL